MKRRVVGGILAALLAVTALSGCESPAEESMRLSRERALQNIELGKACAEAGGRWTWDDWTGYACEIP